MIRRLFIFTALIVALLSACWDNDSFTTDRSAGLTFSIDTLRMDTRFSAVPLPPITSGYIIARTMGFASVPFGWSVAIRVVSVSTLTAATSILSLLIWKCARVIASASLWR